MVVTDLPSIRDTGVAQARVAWPSMCTVQAPHDAMPQPNLVPVSLRCSRRTQSSGVLGSTPSSLRTPLTVKATMRSLRLPVKEIFRIRNEVSGTACRCVNMVPDCHWMVADLSLVREGLHGPERATVARIERSEIRGRPVGGNAVPGFRCAQSGLQKTAVLR